MVVDLLIDESKIRERLALMGRQIEDDYRDKPLTIVAVLTGSLIALADLVRQIRNPFADRTLASEQLSRSDDLLNDAGHQRGVCTRRRRPGCPASR